MRQPRRIGLAETSNVAGRLLLVAAWFALLAGFVEGTAFLALQKLGWLNWNMARKGVSIEIIWISMLFDLFLFGLMALSLAALGRIFHRFRVMHLTVLVCGFLTFFDWVALNGHLEHYAEVTLAAGLAVAFTRWFDRHAPEAVCFWRRSFPWLAGAGFLLLVGIQGGLWLRERIAIASLPESPPHAPNVLVIVVDTLRADHLSTYGYWRPTSPDVDRMGETGVVFENAFATSSWTPPSHASLLTGRYPSEHRVEWNRALDSRYPTLATVLRAHGYRTGAFSANKAWFTRRMGFGRGFIRFEDYFNNLSDMVMRTLYGRALERFGLKRLGCDPRKRAADVNRSVLRWIDRDKGKPFFAFLNYIDTHAPYLPPQPYRGKFSNSRNPGGMLISRRFGDYRNITPEQLRSEVEAYDGAIAYVNHHIAQLSAELHKRGLDGNTLVVITADHGESFGEHGMFFHRNSLYREVIHVPLLFWWPGHVPSGVRVTQAVSNAALPATVMELVGLGDDAVFPGPSLTQVWSTADAHVDLPSPLAEIAQQPFERLKGLPVYYGRMRSLMTARWHYITHETLGNELYDWTRDPGELHNLVERPEMQSIVARFRSQLLQVGQEGAGRQDDEATSALLEARALSGRS